MCLPLRRTDSNSHSHSHDHLPQIPIEVEKVVEVRFFFAWLCFGLCLSPAIPTPDEKRAHLDRLHAEPATERSKDSAVAALVGSLWLVMRATVGTPTYFAASSRIVHGFLS